MKFVIVGCGRVGSTLAESLDRAGHEVVIFDLQTAAFDRLQETFKGTAIRGDGTDAEVLRQGGTEGADIFLALTEGDNRNIMAAQVAAEALGVPRVIAKINDPVRAEAYSSLGLATVCRTNLMVDAISDFLELGISAGPGMTAPTASHDHGPESVHPVIAGAPGVRPATRAGAHVVRDETSGGGGELADSGMAAGAGGAPAATEIPASAASGSAAAAPGGPSGEQAAGEESGNRQNGRESRGFRFRRG